VRETRESALRRVRRSYLSVTKRIWNLLPASLRRLPPVRLYGRHVHALVGRFAERTQSHGTFFFRNRPELELMCRLVNQKRPGSRLDITVLACSKGAEVYSFLWAIRSIRPDLIVNAKAVDISQQILEFAERGVYSCDGAPALECDDGSFLHTTDATWKDQPVSIFERMTDTEMESMFELVGDKAKVRPWLKQGIIWLKGDAGDPELVRVLGPQDIVVANRFLCHMAAPSAEKCLRNIARMVKPGGYLFVSGVDLEVRKLVGAEMRWEPVTELLREIYEGDVSLMNGWPLEWWGQEPFQAKRQDWRTRYASVFQLGMGASMETRRTDSAAECCEASDPCAANLQRLRGDYA
jgi:chemotaxis protein methyltransferase CheR